MPIFLKKRREKCDKFICNALSLFFKPPPPSLKNFLTGEEKNILHFVSQKHFVKQVPTTIKDSRLDFFPGFFFLTRLASGHKNGKMPPHSLMKVNKKVDTKEKRV